MTPVTIITGASAGIGTALARVFARHGHALLLVARRAERLDALAAEIAGTGRPRPVTLPLDLSEPGVATRIAKACAAHSLEPEYVVNNAGFGLVGQAARLDRAGQLNMIDLNMRALTDLSLAFADDLARRHGGILNVASVAGFLPGPGSAVYYASKAYVLSFSEALQCELAPRGVRVTCLCPGPVPTEFQARAGVAEGDSPPLITVSAERVAEAGYRGLMRGQRVVVPGWANKLVASMVSRIAPRALLLSALSRRQVRRAGRRSEPAA